MNDKIALAARLLLGLALAVFGLNGFLNFLPPPQPNAAAGAFLGALAATGYMFPLIKGTELAAGLMLLAGWRAPLALVLAMPVLVNIVAYHVFLDTNGALLGWVLLGLNLLLAYRYRATYAPLLRAEARQEAATAAAPVHA
jgi:hypothetical protein